MKESSITQDKLSLKRYRYIVNNNINASNHHKSDEFYYLLNCNPDNPIDCLSLYRRSVKHGFIWELKVNKKAKGRLGVTYGQRIGLNSDYSTNTITIVHGQVKSLGYGRYGRGDTRSVWIISAWWEW